jgi:hypothetical protein
MPPPSNRPGRNDTVPLVIRPSSPRSAQPVVVPRSSARMQDRLTASGSGWTSCAGIGVVIVKAHGLWAFGFGQGQRIMPCAPIQEKCAR